MKASSVGTQAALYLGTIRHRRMTPVEHAMNYRIFYFYLDLDSLSQTFAVSALLGFSRWKPFSFQEKHYFRTQDSEWSDLGLKQQVQRYVREQTGHSINGKVMLLTQLSVFGYCFNPVSFYYCFDQDNTLRYVLADINNTPWDERYCYCLEWQPGERHQFIFEKTFHVSPFNPMDMVYDWRMTAPGEHLAIHMESLQQGKKHFDATLALDRHELNAANVRRILWQFPLMTAKISAGIYWNALKLWLKKAPFYDHPDTLPSTEPKPSHKAEAPHG